MIKNTDELETISAFALDAVTGGADPAVSAKGELVSFGGTGVNGPPASTQSGGGGTSTLMPLQ